MIEHSYYTDDEFWKHFKLFNVFFAPYQWQDTKAAKAHLDEFGDPVAYSEIYFTRHLHGDVNRLKLSRRSMEKMLMLFFDSNNGAVLLAENLLQIKSDQTSAAIERAFAFAS
ncbi:hypothetical protein [Janthinobacterium sp. BJB401]|uniref:hypothetical protein n=1 Tax=Janthinobacterium sp. BJB401 TaxID=2745934 RepID=UPI0015963D52|nr:hypothetical protein [Janthinobacterium sp. BJB401]NVI83078.1 hypothetical protein [Janthinobacterium sp. BJB401]